MLVPVASASKAMSETTVTMPTVATR